MLRPVSAAVLPPKPAWQALAACVGQDVDFFDEEQTEAARAVCSGCECRVACLAFAVETRTEYGIFGGQSPEERKPQWPKERKPAKVQPAKQPGVVLNVKGHGTRYAYSKGCRCDPCRQANTDYSRELVERRRAG